MLTTYTRLMKESDLYYKIFYLLELSIWNAQILMAKSFRGAPKMLQFREAVVEQLADWRTFQLTVRNPEPAAPIPHFHFNQEHFHYPISNSNRLACKVRIQQVDTTTSMIKAGKAQEDWQNFMEDGGLGQEDQEDCITIHRNETLRISCNFLCIFLVLRWKTKIKVAR